MKRAWVFDGQEQQHITRCRQEFLGRLLGSLSVRQDLETALDVGCGVGFFSGYLSGLGLSVTALDGRAENIAEAKRRSPEVEFHVADVENVNMRALGRFDLVLCFGLLYHLENPFLVLRNLFSVTEKVLIIESMVTPGTSPVATLMDEAESEDQGLNHIAWVSSEASLTKMLYHAGFSRVYETIELPDHNDFRETLFYRRRRAVLVAARSEVHSSLLRAVGESRLQDPDIWRKPFGPLPLKHLRRKVRVILAVALRRARNLVPIPRPIRLPWGGCLLGWGDAMDGALRNGFERQEQGFLMEFLRPGMTFIDIGAHHGLYSLLASKKVGLSGRVVAFEPSPREFRRLSWNLTLNRCRNVRAEPIALGRTDGTADLFICLGGETGCNSLRPPAVSDPVTRIRVPISPLDMYLALAKIGLDHVDFVKLDVEGAELDVLKGATGLLSTARPLILCELADVRTAPWGYRSQEIYEFLKTRGYRWFSITPRARLRPVSVAGHPENLLAVPKEKLQLVADFVEKI